MTTESNKDNRENNLSDDDSPSTRKTSVDETIIYQYGQNAENTPQNDNDAGLASKIEAGIVVGGQYRTVRRTGWGKMDEVWEAFDTVSERTVALKFVSPEIHGYENIMRMVKENFQSIHMLNHQYICPLYALVDDPTFGYFLVMKWMPETLDDYIVEFPDRIPLALIKKIASNIAEALDYAHENGVIHRDVKPQNIAISRGKDGDFLHASLIDFGLAVGIKKSDYPHPAPQVGVSDADVPLVESDSARTGSSTGIGTSGTPAYMPPEQWMGEIQDRCTDQYSLGVVIYELLAGHRPFTGRNRNVLRASVLSDLPEPVPHIPTYVNAALLKALAKKREDRFSSCIEFARALGNSQWQHQRRNSMIRSAIWAVIIVSFVFLVLVRPNKNRQKESWEKHFNDVFVTNIYESQLGALNKAPQGKEPDAGLSVNGTHYPDPKMSANGAGWNYHWEKESATGVITLSGYKGGRITASGFSLRVEVADGTENTVTSNEGHEDAFGVYEGDLSIIGGEAGTGVLKVVKISAEESETANALAVNTSGKNMIVKNLAELNVTGRRCSDAFLVANGTLTAENVQKFTVTADPKHTTAAVFGNTFIRGKASDVYTFSGQIQFIGEFWTNGEPKTGNTPNKPEVQIFVAGKQVDHLVDNFEDMVAALADVTTDTVIMITGNFSVGSYRHPVEGMTSRLIFEKEGRYTVFSAGSFWITRGGSSNRMEELLDVRGELTVNFPESTEKMRLRFNGGASWQKGNDIPKTAKLTTPVSFNISNTAGAELEIYKYENSVPSYAVLINVEGTLNSYSGFIVQNNDNVNFEEFASATMSNQKAYAGGIHIAPDGVFNMFDGRIFGCSAPFGGGVNVNGVFNMHQGVIQNNISWNNGGEYSSEGAGVRICRGTFNMYDGEIINNVAAGKSVKGSSVAPEDPMSVLHGNHAAKGAGIHNSTKSTVHISGGRVTGNISQWAGGGIYAGGNGSGVLTISGGAAISGNLAIIGGGIFMNSSVTLEDALIRDNMVIEDKGNTTVGVTSPKGDGIFIREFAKGNLSMAPSLFLGEGARIDQSNKVYVQSNIIIPPKEQKVGGQTFIPIHVMKPLVTEESVLTLSIGFLGYPYENEGHTELALMKDTVPNVPIPLVSFDYPEAGQSQETDNTQSLKFVFGTLETAPDRTFALKQYISKPKESEDAEKHYLVIAEKE